MFHIHAVYKQQRQDPNLGLHALFYYRPQDPSETCSLIEQWFFCLRSIDETTQIVRV